MTRARLLRVTTALAVLVVAATFFAAQVDFVRRHHPGVTPELYLWPQLTHIWLPGLALAAVLGAMAWWLRRNKS